MNMVKMYLEKRQKAMYIYYILETGRYLEKADQEMIDSGVTNISSLKADKLIKESKQVQEWFVSQMNEIERNIFIPNEFINDISEL